MWPKVRPCPSNRLESFREAILRLGFRGFGSVLRARRIWRVFVDYVAFALDHVWRIVC